MFTLATPALTRMHSRAFDMCIFGDKHRGPVVHDDDRTGFTVQVHDDLALYVRAYISVANTGDGMILDSFDARMLRLDIDGRRYAVWSFPQLTEDDVVDLMRICIK
jgi:hypothetical protein